MPNIFQKIQNKAEKKAIVRMSDESKTKAELIIYADIGNGGWFSEGYSAKDLDRDLKSLPESITELTIRLNSPGGDVFDGVTMYNRLKAYKAKKIVIVEGLAASIASVIMLAGDERIMGEGAMVMIHKPWSGTWGNSDDFLKMADTLDAIEDQMIRIYKNRTNISEIELKQKLQAETWINADEAIEMGFAHSKTDEQVQIAASALDRQWFKNKTPKIANTNTMAAKAAASELSKKIEARLSARK